MNILILAAVTLSGFILSIIKSKSKTVKVLKQSAKIGGNMFPQILGILLVISLLLSLISDDLIVTLLGSDNGLFNVTMGAFIGAVTIIPGIIAFPLGKELINAGAVPMAVAAFITTLTMVGIATAPIEIKHFGRKFTFYRNTISFGFALIIAIGMGGLL